MTILQERILREVVSRYKQGAVDGVYSHKIGDPVQVEITGGELGTLGYIVLVAGDPSVTYKRLKATASGVQWVDADDAAKAQAKAAADAAQAAQLQAWKTEHNTLYTDIETAYTDWSSLTNAQRTEMQRKVLRFLWLRNKFTSA